MNRALYVVAAIAVLAALGFGAWSLLANLMPSSQGPSADPSANGFPDDTYIPYPSTGSGSSGGTTSNTPTDTPAGTPEGQAARAAYEAALSADNPDNIKAGQTVAVAGYALQLWTGDNTGGEALLKFNSAQNAWVIVDPGGGQWSLEGLMHAGVPQEAARALLAGVGR